MKYKDCLDCNQLGKTCDGPNTITMETYELGLWCNELRKRKPWMTYDWIHNETGVSKTAVHDFLTGERKDFRRETFRPIVRCVIGGDWSNNPCGNVTNTEKAAFEETIRQLEHEISWRDDKIQHLQGSNQSMTTLITNTNARYTSDKAFLQDQIKSKNKTIVILASCLGVSLLLIITALIVDRFNPDIGFIWLRGLFHTGTENVFDVIAKRLP